MNSRTISIDNCVIGGDTPCFIIAEIGANHNQQLDVAKKLIDSALEAGADAVKFQSFKVNDWISKDFTEFPTMQDVTDLHGTLKKAELSYELLSRIMAYCSQNDIICFSTPSHINDVNRLYDMGVPAFKFGSVQVTDLPTIVHAANYGRPVMISGGASDMSEVSRAVEAIMDTGNDQLVLLHCTSLYPCHDYSFLNLNILKAYQSVFDFPIGYSDHTLDPTIVPVTAAAMGAKIIEKHITLDRKMEGPDHAFALEPTEFTMMVRAIRRTEEALGNRYLRQLKEEKEIARMGRRSLVSTRAIKTGEVLSANDITIKRPGYGIEPIHLELVIGRSARQDIEANRVLTWDMI